MSQPTDKPIAHPAEPGSNAAQLPTGLNPGLKQWSSQDLFCGTREVLIQHFGASYRLRITHANKLILTK